MSRYKSAVLPAFPDKSFTHESLQRRMKTGEFLVLDTETTLIEKDSSIYSNPPTFVLGAIRCCGTTHMFTDAPCMADNLCAHDLIVGHNLSYDLCILGQGCKTDILYWDTMLVQYLITHQASKFASLNECAAFFDIPFSKEETVSEMIKTGVPVETIPRDLLEKYLETDVLLTEAVFKAQYNYIIRYFSNEWIEMMINQLQWRATTHNISMDGLKLDKDLLDASLARMEVRYDFLQKDITKQMKASFDYFFGLTFPSYTGPYSSEADISVDSPKQLLTLLQGGEIVYVRIEETGEVYKTGPNKGLSKKRKIKSSILINAASDVVISDTSNESITRIIKNTKSTIVKYFCEDLLEYRNIAKTKKTYFEGYSKFMDDRGFIHPQFNHCLTPSGRISATKPNSQNIKGDE
jgi:DNA polymerase I-like protein with 3'-5' exonuclease and polymerase domains